MTLDKKERENIDGLADDMDDCANTLRDAVASWEDADRDERESLHDEIEQALREAVTIGERAWRYWSRISNG